jgi:hypothetical protein
MWKNCLRLQRLPEFLGSPSGGFIDWYALGESLPSVWVASYAFCPQTSTNTFVKGGERYEASDAQISRGL